MHIPPLSRLTTLLTVSTLLSPVLCRSRAACQYPTSNPLYGCPKGTLLVGPAGTKNANFSSIQSAVLSLPHDDSPATILVLPGNYSEQLNVTRPGALTLLGQTSSPNKQSANGVRVLWHSATGNAESSIDNAFTAVLTVAPTLNASLTGSGPTGNAVPADTAFGSADFRVYNVDFSNEYREYAAGPSLAISVSYANAGFYHVGVFSYQDTVSTRSRFILT